MKRHSPILATIPNLFLLFLFFACMLATLLAGVKVYQGVSGVLDEKYSTTTCMNYLSAKVRHYDKQDGVGCKKIGDKMALALYDTYEGEVYITYVYVFDGYLTELFCSAEGEFLPEDGQKIMPLTELKIDLNQQLLSVQCSYHGKEAFALLTLHSKGKGES